MNEITLMMATYNRLPLTKRMLDNLFDNTDINFNFVIIDNGSSDGTPEFLKDLILNPNDKIKKIHLILNNSNKGIAVARNQALKVADEMQTDWYCCIDNDVEVPKGWLGECVSIMKANRQYGMIGVNMEGTAYPLITQNGYTFQNKPAGNLGTACMVFSKPVHKMLGFFNCTDYSHYYGLEDSDFGMRTRIAGFKLGYIETMGNHFGVGENDTGDYRAFKTKEHDSMVPVFKKNCVLYSQGTKPLYISYKDE